MKKFKNIDLSDVLVNQGQIKLLFNVEGERVKSLMDGRRKIPVSEVSEIIGKNTVSYDPRYDKIDKVQLTIQSIREDGLPASIKLAALNNKANIKKKKLTGIYDVFNQILSYELLDEINKNLQYKFDYIYTKGHKV